MTDYANHARAWERDPVITPGAHGRADVANGKRGRWGRYNDPASLVWVDTLEGRTVGLTRNQANVLMAIQEIAGTGARVTMRSLAASLGIVASSVYRACVRLQALSLIAYQSNRGRLGGSVFLMRARRDGLDWARDEAKAKLRKWWKASEARLNRVRLNVASCFPGREQELYQYKNSTERNIKTEYAAWSVDDLREAGLM